MFRFWKSKTTVTGNSYPITISDRTQLSLMYQYHHSPIKSMLLVARLYARLCASSSLLPWVPVAPPHSILSSSESKLAELRVPSLSLQTTTWQSQPPPTALRIMPKRSWTTFRVIRPLWGGFKLVGVINLMRLNKLNVIVKICIGLCWCRNFS